MIEYIYTTSIDEKIIKKAAFILSDGGLVAYPTDTSWGIGCSINSNRGIESLRRLKGNRKKELFTLICSSISQISQVAYLGNFHFKLIKKHTPGPFVFILPARQKIEKIVNTKRIEIGVRIPSHPVPLKIVETIGHPIFTTTASKWLTRQKPQDPATTEEALFESGWELEYIDGIDLILDTGETLPKVLSTVVDMTRESIEVVREGIGEFSL
ncbi:MAG: threonylcarbamoyl-AMP synthase [Spirochaetales bacterium]|nr:threonylcarbamoyl-AMP synthase [Spirochaetales bacterium]